MFGRWVLILYIYIVEENFAFDLTFLNQIEKFTLGHYGTLDHFLSKKVMVFDNFLAADKHK